MFYSFNFFAKLQPFIFKGGVFSFQGFEFASGGGAFFRADWRGELFVQFAGARGDLRHARFHGSAEQPDPGRHDDEQPSQRQGQTPENSLHDTGICKASDICVFCELGRAFPFFISEIP